MKKCIFLFLLVGVAAAGCTLNRPSSTGSTRDINALGGFCGSASKAACQTDADCIAGGCSGQLCHGVTEEVGTTCEWKECYDDTKFGISCGCVNGQCLWYK